MVSARSALLSALVLYHSNGAAASASPELVAHARALMARQAQSDAGNLCHAECGYTIIEASSEGYCSNQTWIDQANRCLDTTCSDSLWENYGSGVAGVAQGCGQTATPGASLVIAAATASASASGTAPTAAATATATGEASVPTEVTGCHTHSDGYYCFEGDAEWELTTELENYDDAPDDYSECQAGENNDTIQCADGSGGQVTLIREGSEEEDHDHDHASSTTSAASTVSETPSATDAAAEASSSAPANAGNAVLPASGVSLFALVAYFL